MSHYQSLGQYHCYLDVPILSPNKETAKLNIHDSIEIIKEDYMKSTTLLITKVNNIQYCFKKKLWICFVMSTTKLLFEPPQKEPHWLILLEWKVTSFISAWLNHETRADYKVTLPVLKKRIRQLWSITKIYHFALLCQLTCNTNSSQNSNDLESFCGNTDICYFRRVSDVVCVVLINRKR